MIRNQYLDRHEKMEWLDYLFTKFHPDECSYYEKRGRSTKSSSKLMTPLAGIIQGCKLLQPDFPSEPRNEDSTDTGKSIWFERHKTVPEKWLVLRVGFDPTIYILSGENRFEWAI